MHIATVILACIIPMISCGRHVARLPETFIDPDNPESDKLNLRAELSPEDRAALSTLADEVGALGRRCKRRIVRCLMNAPPATLRDEFCYVFTSQESCIKREGKRGPRCTEQEFEVIRNAACAGGGQNPETARDARASDSKSRQKRSKVFDPNEFELNITYSNQEPV